MWPWEHVAFAYLAYSVFCHGVFRDGPGGREAAAVAFAAVLPDLIDKPLAWEFGVFASGYALGHSIFAVALVAPAAVAIAGAFGNARVGLAFAVGHALHLVGDVIPIYVETGEVSVTHLLWPVVTTRSPHQPHELTEGFLRNFEPYAAQLAALEPTPYLAAQLAVAGATLVLWLYDGTPGLGTVRSSGRET